MATTFTKMYESFFLGDEFTPKDKQNNVNDKYAVAVLPLKPKSKKIVRHLPRDIYKECCWFILHGVRLWELSKAGEPKILNHAVG